jgi:translation elongation factor P/translation initiation factor 5A
MLMTSQLKVGTAFMYEGNPLIVQKMLGQRSGRAGMVTSLRVKNLVTNSTMDLGIDAGEKFDEVDLESHVTKLSYIDGETFVAAQNKLGKLTKKEQDKVTDLYVKLLPIMKQYNIDRSQIQKS